MIQTTCKAAMAFFFILVATTVQAEDHAGGPVSRFLSRIRSHNSSFASHEQEAVPPSAPVESAVALPGGGSDPYGFLSILNRLRATAGLHPVSYDSSLTSWAHRNNVVQCVRGLGHHVSPGCVQNCGWNYSDAPSVAQGWMESPGHRQNMLDPSITRVGIAFGPGPYWTLNAR